MPNGLFALAEVPRELSEEKLADFLVLNHADLASTLYRDVFRLLPAHVMRVTADGSGERRAATGRRPTSRRCGSQSDADYAEGLRATLDRAVRRQMRSAHPVGCLLSGGLDSSSVSVLAARALAESNATSCRLHRRAAPQALPAKWRPATYADETPYVEAIAEAAGNIDVTYVRTDACDDFAELERFFMALEAPVRNPSNLGWVLALLRLARAQGHRVLLGGLYGNYHHQLDRLVAGARSSEARRLRHRLPPVAALLPPHALFALGAPCASCSSSRWCRSGSPPGPSAAAIASAAAPGRSTPPSVPTSPPPWRSMRAPAQAGHDFPLPPARRRAPARARPGRLCRRLVRGRKGGHRRRGARPHRRPRRGRLLLRRAARAVSRRGHRPLADPPRHVGPACRRRC